PRPKGAPVINFRSEGRRPERALPYPGVALLRVHRRQVAEMEVAVHQDRRGLVLLCGTVAPDARRWRRRVHTPYDRARSGCSADPQSADGGVGAIGLAGVARPDQT